MGPTDAAKGEDAHQASSQGQDQDRNAQADDAHAEIEPQRVVNPMAQTHQAYYVNAQPDRQGQFLPDVAGRSAGPALAGNSNLRSGFITAKPSKRKRKLGGGKATSPDRATASTSGVGGPGFTDHLRNPQNHASQPLMGVANNAPIQSTMSHQSHQYISYNHDISAKSQLLGPDIINIGAGSAGFATASLPGPEKAGTNQINIVAKKRPPAMPIKNYVHHGVDPKRKVLYRNFHDVDGTIYLVEISRN